MMNWQVLHQRVLARLTAVDWKSNYNEHRCLQSYTQGHVAKVKLCGHWENFIMKAIIISRTLQFHHKVWLLSSSATTSSQLGVQFLGLGYNYPSTEKKLDRSTQFGAVGYIIILYSSKSYVKTSGAVQILGVRIPDPPVVAPMLMS